MVKNYLETFGNFNCVINTLLILIINPLFTVGWILTTILYLLHLSNLIFWTGLWLCIVPECTIALLYSSKIIWILLKATKSFFDVNYFLSAKLLPIILVLKNRQHPLNVITWCNGFTTPCGQKVWWAVKQNGLSVHKGNKLSALANHRDKCT